MKQMDVVCEMGEAPAMMVSVPHFDIPLQESAVPMPAPLRAALYCLFVSTLTASLYVCIQGAIMIYDFYQILQWLGELAEHA